MYSYSMSLPSLDNYPALNFVTAFFGFTCGCKKSKTIIKVCSKSHSYHVGPILTELKKNCSMPVTVLQRVADCMAKDMRDGLNDELRGSELKMLLSYVHCLPSGDEEGLFYALDIGGTNFRVLRVQLGGRGQRVIATELEQLSIPRELMSGTSEELFDFIASGLAKFVEKEKRGNFCNPPDRKRELGFSFSFPVKQSSIDSGILIKWTKGFAVSGTVGKDLAGCLNEAMERQGLDLQVSALVNDAVGTLAGAKYWDNDVMVAVILGTGTNACYVERTNAIPKLKFQKLPSESTIISMEWGAFSKGLPLTEFDRDMDTSSINPGEQIFEKMISGMYLCEIVRRVLFKMAKIEALFGESILMSLSTPYILRTQDLCAMQLDDTDDLQVVGSTLYNMAGVESDFSAREIVVEVCDTIIKRGAHLAGAGIVGILQKMEEDSNGGIFGKRVVVAVDGSLYEHYPQYRNYLLNAVKELLGSERSKDVTIKHTKDGSSIGAALLAAAISKYRHGV